MSDTGTAIAAEEAAERHSTNLELFLDLVFVFAISQLAKLIASEISVAGVGRSLVVAWTVWWVWQQFTWLGTAVDLDRDTPTRLTFLAAIVPALFMAISLPGAYGDTGPQFGLGVLATSLWALLLQAVGLWGDPGTRRAFIRYGSVAVLGPIVIAIGGFLDAEARPWIWAGAALIAFVAVAIGGGKEGKEGSDESQWTIDPVHFSERHALFVIIVLGEVLVAIGAAASEHGLTAVTGWAVIASAYLAAVIWWAYFGFVAAFGERLLRGSVGRQRTVHARSFFMLGHFPLIAGIACLATVIEHVVAHPDEHLHRAEQGLLMLSLVLIVGAFLTTHWIGAHGVAPERLVSIAACAFSIFTVGGDIEPALLIAIIAAVLTVSQAITHRRAIRTFAAP